MNKDKEQQNIGKAPSALSESVLDRLTTEEVSPMPKWCFTCFNYSVWVLWAFSVLIGALSVAVLVYVGDHARFALYEATHTTPLSFFVEVLPYVWIGAFILMCGIAYYNVRHTKGGYKYPMWHILISSVLFSLVGGVILNVFGVGYLIDTQVGKHMPVYRSLERFESEVWQKPTEGRLVGIFSTMDEADVMYMFIDAQEEQWSIDTAELRKPDRDLLSSGRQVRVLGTTTDSGARIFHACGVFPWMLDKNPSVTDMQNDRKVFLERMYDHMETGERLRGLEKEVFEQGTHKMPFTEGLCAELAIVKRMKF
ncbi:MAG: hypothetical protein ACI9H6_000612 [Patiriisocius sp.]|jgi:hypothetical protein